MSGLFKKDIDLSGLDSTAQATLKTAKSREIGLFGEKANHGDTPNFITLPCENVIAGENNSFIVLGRDRPASRMSGYGGKGSSHAGSIDIVVGRMGRTARKTDSSGNQMNVDPSFELDAARIYISQKTDVDANFGLVKGSVGNAVARSAIALKADGIRIIGREGIKLVTRTDKKNSQDGDLFDLYGVDLIAGNSDDDLQAMVKGGNLVIALEQIEKQMSDLAGIVNNFLTVQMKFNTEIATHFHISPFFSLPSVPSEVLVPEGARAAMDLLNKGIRQILMFKYNLANFQMNHLTPTGKIYINSRFHHLN
jgi:hypothetical protein